MGITQFIADFATQFISSSGYIGVFVLMTMESMIFPVPSEAVMPFAGFNIVMGNFTFLGVLVASTLGSIAGSLLSYWIGRAGGRPFVDRFGKWFLLSRHDLELTERFFAKRGELTILVARFIPVVRHLISIPAGAARMPIGKFLLFTILGAGAWNAILAWAGIELKKNWTEIMKYSHVVDLFVVGILVLAAGFFVWTHLKRRKRAE